MMGSSDSTKDEIKYRIEMLRILYARGYNLIPVRSAVLNFADYFDSNQYFTLEELIRFVGRGYGIVLYKHKDDWTLIGTDMDVQDKNLLRAIEPVLGNTLVQRTRRGYHLLFFLLFYYYYYYYYVNGSDNVTQEWHTITGMLDNLTQVSVRTCLICSII